jgi:hypothetical protein
MITIHAKLLEAVCDIEGYITYVFQILDQERTYLVSSDYLMCVRYPNWEQSEIKKGDQGYLKVKEVAAGKDQWFDGHEMIYYRNDDIIFYKFIKETEQTDIITL